MHLPHQAADYGLPSVLTQDGGQRISASVFAPRPPVSGRPEDFLSPTRLVATDGARRLVSVAALTSWIAGTADQLTVGDDGDGTVTISLPSALTLPGTLTVTGHTTPAVDNTYDLGSATFRWRDGRFSRDVYVSGQILASDGVVGAPGIAFSQDPDNGLRRTGTNAISIVTAGADIVGINGTAGIRIRGSLGLTWSSAADVTSTSDLVLLRDAANILALRNGASSQELRLYGTFTDTSNYERLRIICDSSAGYVITHKAGTGVARALIVGTDVTSSLNLRTDAVNRWQVRFDGHFVAVTDNAIDIGMSAATRPRTIYVGTNAVIGNYVRVGTSTNASAAGDLSAGGSTSDLFFDESTRSLIISSSTLGTNITLEGPAGAQRQLNFRTGSSLRWVLLATTDAESGSNAGSNFQIFARTDAGGSLRTDLTITRSTGKWEIPGTVQINSEVIYASNVNTLFSNDANAYIYRTGGSAGDFSAEAGHLVLQPRTSAARDIMFATGSTSPSIRWKITSNGHQVANVDNTYDIGPSSLRPRTVHVGTSVVVVAGAVTLDTNGITMGDAKNFIVNATTGTKFGTATTQKMGWWNATPVVQPAAVADAAGGATVDTEARTAINTLLARLRTTGLIAT